MDSDRQWCGRAAEIALTFTEHADRVDAEHVARCPDCATAVRELRAGAEVSPEMERRLLRGFRDWRDGA